MTFLPSPLVSDISVGSLRRRRSACPAIRIGADLWLRGRRHALARAVLASNFLPRPGLFLSFPVAFPDTLGAVRPTSLSCAVFWSCLRAVFVQFPRL